MKNKKVQVCSNCFKASCWYGEFLCENSYNANVVFKTVEELKELKLENADYWSDEYMTKIYGEPNPFGFAIDHEQLRKDDQLKDEENLIWTIEEIYCKKMVPEMFKIKCTDLMCTRYMPISDLINYVLVEKDCRKCKQAGDYEAWENGEVYESETCGYCCDNDKFSPKVGDQYEKI